MPFCPFCYDTIKDRVVAEQNSVVAIEDNYPVTDGHLLIVPRRHIEDYFSMNETERRDIDGLIMKLKNCITEMITLSPVLILEPLSEKPPGRRSFMRTYT
jgi:diadenosine tetraphosphate (Ap4A) HIT family hydrolase